MSLGVTHFDTAELYHTKMEDGSIKWNEELVGKFLAKLGPAKVKEKGITVGTKYNPGLHLNVRLAMVDGGGGALLF